MQHVSVHEAKTHLSRLIKQIEAGKEIVITNFGRPVCKIVGLGKAKKRTSGDLAHLAHKYPLPENFDDPMPEDWFFPDENKFSDDIPH